MAPFHLNFFLQEYKTDIRVRDVIPLIKQARQFTDGAKNSGQEIWKCLSGGSSSDQAGAGTVCRHEGHRSHRQKAAAGD